VSSAEGLRWSGLYLYQNPMRFVRRAAKRETLSIIVGSSAGHKAARARWIRYVVLFDQARLAVFLSLQHHEERNQSDTADRKPRKATPESSRGAADGNADSCTSGREEQGNEATDGEHSGLRSTKTATKQ
jgi:hypothetical protein